MSVLCGTVFLVRVREPSLAQAHGDKVHIRNGVAVARSGVAQARNSVVQARNSVIPARNSVIPARNSVALARNGEARDSAYLRGLKRPTTLTIYTTARFQSK